MSGRKDAAGLFAFIAAAGFLIGALIAVLVSAAGAA